MSMGVILLVFGLALASTIAIYFEDKQEEKYMLSFVICMMAWYFLNKYTDTPWFWKFCIVCLIMILL